MAGILTEHGTKYYFDPQSKVFVGGRYKNPRKYSNLTAIVGEPATIYLENGNIVRTSRVLRFI